MINAENLKVLRSLDRKRDNLAFGNLSWFPQGDACAAVNSLGDLLDEIERLQNLKGGQL